MDAETAQALAGLLLFAPMYFPLAWIVCECSSTSTGRLKNKGTEWDSGIHGIGTFYARMMQHTSVAFAGVIGAVVLCLFDLAVFQYPYNRNFPLGDRNFPVGLSIVVGGIGTVLMMYFGWRARLAREAYTEWKKLERMQPQFTEVNGNLYRLVRVYKDGRSDQDNSSPSERLQANQTYLAEADQRVAKAGRELVIALVVSAVLWMIAAFALSHFRHHPAWDAAVPILLVMCICAYPVGVWITNSWDMSLHRGNSQYISAPRPIKEIAGIASLKDIADAKPTGAAKFAPIQPAPARPVTPPPNPWEPPQSPHQPPQSPHKPTPTAPKYKDPFE